METIRNLWQTGTRARLLWQGGLFAWTVIVLLSAVVFGDVGKQQDPCAVWGFEGALVGASLKADGTLGQSELPNLPRVEFMLRNPPRLEFSGQGGAACFVIKGAVPRGGAPGAVILESPPDDCALEGCEAAATRLCPVAKSVEGRVTLVAGRTDFVFSGLCHYGFAGRSCPCLFEIEQGPSRVRVRRVNWFNNGSYHYLARKLKLFGVAFDVSRWPLVFRIIDGRYVHVRGEGTATLSDGQIVRFSAMESSVSREGRMHCRELRITKFAEERGSLYFRKPEGRVGLGQSDEEAEANMAPLQVGQLPEGNDILFVELRQPFYGLTTIYLNSRYRLHRATWELLEVNALEDKLVKGDESSVKGLLKYLHRDSILARRASAKALAKADATAVPSLAIALKDPDPEVRANAARSLAVIGSARVPTLLREALAIETDPNVRKAIDDAMNHDN